MSDEIADLARRLVVGHKRDGRSVYDEQAKAELVAACIKPGTSVSRLARECGVNANQLSRWVREHGQRQRKVAAAVSAPPVPTSFVPVAIEAACPVPSEASLNVQATLPNGVVVDLRGCGVQQAGQLIEALGRMRCSASTKG
jgi:transposase